MRRTRTGRPRITAGRGRVVYGPGRAPAGTTLHRRHDAFTCDYPHRIGAVPLQVMGQGLGDVPVVPELRFAPRRTRPRIPGCAARGGTTDSGRPLWGSFFHRQMSCRPAGAGVGECL